MKHKSIYAWRKPGGRLKARPYVSFIGIVVGWPTVQHSCLPRRHSCRRMVVNPKTSVETSLDAAGKSARATKR